MQINNLKMLMYYVASPITRWKSSFAKGSDALINGKKEARISKYVKFHDTRLMEGDAAAQIYAMREPIAKFAKKHNLTVDIYDPQNLEAHQRKNVQIGDAPETIGIVVTNIRNNQNETLVLPSDASKIYTKNLAKKIIIPPRAEGDVPVERIAKSVSEDVFIKRVLNFIDSANLKLNDNAKS